VVRNRAKRRLRELFRMRRAGDANLRHRQGLDLVVIPKRELPTASPVALRADFNAALTRLSKGTRG
jgi:ribonuclease P protein component